MKTRSNFKVVRLNGETFDLGELGIIVNSFLVDSPSYKHYTEEIPGMSGHIDMGTDVEGRTMQTKITIVPVDFYDYELMRNEVFRIFRSEESFYIIRDAEPGKRILVKCQSKYLPERIANIGEMTIPFISSSAYFESIGTTQDPFTFDSELWQFGQGLVGEELHYTHSTGVFNIYNAGDVTINPVNINMTLVIEYRGASNNLTIKNETTGDEWKYTGASFTDDVIRLDGVRAERSGLSIVGATNFKVITLAPGWNSFRLTGTSGAFEIKFIFRFLYK